MSAVVANVSCFLLILAVFFVSVKRIVLARLLEYIGWYAHVSPSTACIGCIRFVHRYMRRARAEVTADGHLPRNGI